VVILLQGRFAGRHAVFLKQLDSGLLLVTGPYAQNSVPLRRVDQSSVIATSTKVTLNAPNLSACTDDLFSAKAARAARSAAVSKGENFFASAKATADIPAARKDLQTKVDAAISLTKEQGLYLKSRFKLSQGDRPHEMKF
jgi:large subunit ribosomal protein L6e